MSQKYDPPVYIEERKMKTLKAAANSKSVKIYDVMMIIFCSTVSDFDWKEISSVILEASILKSKIKLRRNCFHFLGISEQWIFLKS